MLLNDKLGDCTIAGALHLIQLFCAVTGKPFTPDNNMALAAYESICGYNPNDPNTDTGGVLLNVLNAWQKVGIAGHKIDAFALVDVHNETEVKQAISLFGGLYTGKDLPIAAQTEDIWWDPSPNDGGLWGGHCTPDMDYDEGTGPDAAGPGLDLITWAAVKRETWAFFQRYTIEAYVVIDFDFLEASGVSPSGLTMDQLRADLALIR